MQAPTIRRGWALFPRPSCGWLWIVVWLASWHETAFAQGSRDDYRRAAQLRESVKQTVFRDQVQPHWIDATTFWYRISIGRQQHQFVLVDAAQGKRERLFDHERLAAALSDKLARKVKADALPLVNVTVDTDLKHVRFTVDRHRLRCDLSEYVLDDVTSANPDRESLPPLAKIQAASRTTGAESEVTFVNQSNQNVRLFWRNLEGKRVAYGTIVAGGQHRQHTYAGHAWEVTDLQDRPLVGFVATTEPNQAVITKDLQPLKPTELLPRAVDSHRSPDGQWTVRFDYNQRGHQVVAPDRARSRTKRARAVIDEQSETFIDYSQKTYLRARSRDGKRRWLWMSERGGLEPPLSGRRGRGQGDRKRSPRATGSYAAWTRVD